MGRRLAQDRGVVAVGDDHARSLGQERFAVQRAMVEPGRHRPEEAVAMVEIVEPFAVAEQIGARHLDLDDDDLAARVDRHDVGAAAAVERHFAHRRQIVPRAACE